MRLPLALALLGLITSSAWAQATAPAAPVHFPLTVAETYVDLKDPSLPALTVGNLPDDLRPSYATSATSQPRWDSFPNGQAKAIPALVTATAKLSPPEVGKPLAMLLAAPYRNLAYHWQPTGITLNNHTFTVHVDEWADPHTDRSKNFSRRECFLLTLPALPEGAYTLALEVRQLVTSPTASEFYTHEDTSFASTPLRVMDPKGDSERRPTVAKLTAEALQPQHPFAGKNRPLILFQPPLHWSRILRHQNGEPSFTVGKLNAYKYMEDFDKADTTGAPTHLPKAAATNSADDLYAIIAGPTMNLGEQLVLDQITWDRRTCTIRVTAWQDTGVRSRNMVFQPFLVVPIRIPPAATPAAPPAEVAVAVEYLPYHAEAPTRSYTLQPQKAPAIPPVKVRLQR